MRFRHHDAHPDLQGLIPGYWELEDLYLERPVQNANLPEGTLRLLFSAEPVLTGLDTVSLQTLLPVTLTRFACGPQESVMQGRFRVLVAEVYPWTARQLLGWHVDEPPDRLNSALSGSAWGKEVVALLKMGDWDAAREALETQLLTLAGHREATGLGVQAARRIYQSRGTVRVAELAETLSVSRSTLERQFAQQVGLRAKTLARVVRFDAANDRIRKNPGVPMADLTFEFGFFDQAHLTNEFRTLAGMTPGTFAALAADHRHSLELHRTQRNGDSYLELQVPPGSGLGRH